MIDISKQNVDIDCPECGESITITLQQVAEGDLITCTCGQGIQLKDSNGESKKAIQDINRSFKDLEDTFKNFGK
jgi:hypothetical protein